MMNDYESENEGEEPPAQEAAEEEAKEPPLPSQSSRDVVYVVWCQQGEKAENTRLYHRIYKLQSRPSASAASGAFPAPDAWQK